MRAREAGKYGGKSVAEESSGVYRRSERARGRDSFDTAALRQKTGPGASSILPESVIRVEYSPV